MFKITEEYGIEHDNYNIVLMQKRKPKKEEAEITYKVVGYFQNYENLLNFFVDQRISVPDSVMEITNELKQIRSEIHSIIKTIVTEENKIRMLKARSMEEIDNEIKKKRAKTQEANMKEVQDVQN